MLIILIGTKAQLIKMAPVIRILDEQGAEFKLVLTGQHKETMYDLIKSFNIRSPDDVLVDQGESDTSFKLLKWFLKAFTAINKRKYLKSDATLIVVHGDTLSTLFGALVGKLYKVPVAHIEAGLRSFNYFNPFPEELIRVLVSRMSEIHYCPGQWACENINNDKKNIVNTCTNTLLDTFKYAYKQINKECNEKQKYAIVSLHRYENLSNKKRFYFLMKQVIKISKKIKIKFILHPVTKKKLETAMWRVRLENESNIELCERMDYIKFIQLLNSAEYIITDGGSNQEEAYYLNKPCLLFRSHTERMEGLSENVTISDYDPEVINKFVMQYKTVQNRPDFNSNNPSQIIVNHLISSYS